MADVGDQAQAESLRQTEEERPQWRRLGGHHRPDPTALPPGLPKCGLQGLPRLGEVNPEILRGAQAAGREDRKHVAQGAQGTQRGKGTPTGTRWRSHRWKDPGQLEEMVILRMDPAFPVPTSPDPRGTGSQGLEAVIP